MSGQRGQAAVELVMVTALVIGLTVGGMDVLRVLGARDQAERMAGQAAALTAEGRPLPAALRAHVRVAGGRAEARVRACAITATVGCFTVRAVAVLP